MKLVKNTAKTVLSNVKNVMIHPPIVMYVVETEKIQQYVTVHKELMKLTKKLAQIVWKYVKIVKMEHLVKFVKMDMDQHQIVHGLMFPKVLK